MAGESQLPRDWTIQTIGNLGRVLTGKTPSTKNADNFGGHIPFITPSDMDGRRLIIHTARHLTEQGAASVSSARIPRGAVMVSCIGSDMGKSAIAGCDAVTNQQINSIIVGQGISNLYIYYNMSTRKSEIQHIGSSGSAVPILNKGHFSQLQIALPPLKDQQAIAHILGTLDDKIELNRKMNDTLEAMARALFKSWFVDFDPVRAKAEGRKPPGLDAQTAALFPGSFQDSPLGKFPKGWRVSPLSEAIDFLEGPGIRNWQYTNNDEGVRFINIRCIKDHDLILDTANRVKESEAWGNYKHFHLEQGDIVVSTSGTLGRFAFVRKEHLPLLLNTSVIRMRPKENLSRDFLWHYIESDSFQFELISRASGSVQLNFGPMHLKQISMVIPPKSILDKYTELTGCLHQKYLLNMSNNDLLSSIRDSLLPKLLSGEIRVKDAEKFVEGDH